MVKKKIALGVVMFIYIILIFFSACTSLTKKQSHVSHIRLMDKVLDSYDNTLPYQNFIFIEKYILFDEKEEIFCHSDNESSDCEFILYGEGSGIAIDHKKNKVRILTAQHVCEEQTSEALGLIFENKNGEYDYPTFKLKVYFYGKSYDSIVIKSDPTNDLCVMEIQSEYSHKIKTVQVANQKPKMGEEVYSLSAPLGIASNFTRLKFHGSWAGCDSELVGEDYCYYTIPAAPGSSGSGVFNKSGELVSILSIAMKGFDEISGGPRQFFIKDILRKN